MTSCLCNSRSYDRPHHPLHQVLAALVLQLEHAAYGSRIDAWTMTKAREMARDLFFSIVHNRGDDDQCHSLF
jgi:hypothetical protein